MQNIKVAPHEQVLSTIIAVWQGHALGVVTELGLPDILADGPIHVDELASRTQTDALALFRLLRALESIGIFTQASPRVFANTPTSECLRRDVPRSQWALVLSNLSSGNGLIDGWSELGYVKTGAVALTKVYGHDFWELCRRNAKNL